ncbi:MAG: hypothetical protein ABW109_22035, partial [Candidatus Thiodiazotropha sp. 6PLUC4]
MAEIQSFNGGSTSRNLQGDGTNSAVSDSQNPTEQNSQNQTAEKQFSGMTTEERLKSSQSPLDNFLSDTSQLASDTADAVTDLATDAYQGMKEINQEYALGQRAMGALKMLGGAGEAFVGSIGIMAPEPLTTVGGSILFVHGSDVASSGFQEILTGNPVETVTDQVTTETAKLLGADDVAAHQFGDNVDMAISLGSAGVGVYQAMTRPVLAELGPMTIKSSTKADPTSELSAGAKTQAQKGANVTAEVADPGLSVPVVTAEARVSGSVFRDVNQTARTGANADQPTMIADRITEKTALSGKALPNGNMGTAHAEVGAIQQAFDAGATTGADMTLNVTGKAVCGYCRGDVAAMAEKASLKSLTVFEEATGNTLYWKSGMNS